MQLTLAILRRSELTLIVTLLLSMLLISVIQIILRNFFNEGFIWAESLVRLMVLWIALVGAMIASRQASHISMDVLLKYTKGQYKILVSRIVFLGTAIVCFITTYYCTIFVYVEYQENAIAFAHVPSWICSIIMPVAFFVIALRYAILTINPSLAKKDIPE